MSEEQTAVMLGSAAAVAILFLLNRFKPAGLKSLQSQIVDLCKSITGKDGLAERLTRLETGYSLFSKVIENKLIDAFHSPHTPEIDRLLEKWKASKITTEEMCDLKHKIEDELQRVDKKSSIYLAGTLLVATLEARSPDW